MKRNENRKNRNWRNFVVLTLVCMLAATLVGCKTSVAVTPEPSTSEVVSEPVSEPVSEEVSEPASEEPSEEVEVEMDLTPYTISNGKFVVDLVADMDYDELKIIVWGYEGDEDCAKAILSNGDTYQISQDDSLYLYYPMEMSMIQPNAEYIEMYSEKENRCGFALNTSGENIEVAFTATDIDGKEYEITVYLTKP